LDRNAPVESVDWSQNSLVATAVSANLEYNFLDAEKGERFQLQLPTTATVGDAKAAIAARCEVDAEDVNLLFLGKRLQDDFFMNRMRIGAKDVYVQVNRAGDISVESVLALKK
jgi:hypothetical protein